MINTIKELLTLFLIFPLVLIFGTYFSARLKFLQFTKLKEALSLVTLKERKGSLSSFGALAAILGGNLGTGNISGVAVAIMTGGPGSIFWMWVMASLAAIYKYMGCFLGVHFQKEDSLGEWGGGPMYYLKYGLGSNKLAKLFCVFTIMSAFTVGNLVQVHALSLPIDDLGVNPFWFSVPMALLVGGVVFGGLKRFSAVVSSLVPAMAITYVFTCLLILLFNWQAIPDAVMLIISSAFDVKPIAGGTFGYAIFYSIRSGFDRGLFATDSGLGLAPILHSSVYDPNNSRDNRHTQGLISILSPLIVMLVCTATGLVLITTGAVNRVDLASTRMCMEAFRLGFNFHWAGHLVSVTLFFFAFTTILTWNFCASRAVEFLAGLSMVKPFQLLFILLIPFGVLVSEGMIWNIADLSINFMFLLNVTGIIGLFKLVYRNR